MVDLSVDLCGVKLDNPIIPASGTFGFGYEFAKFYDINILGSIALKGTTKQARFGNPTPRIAECTSGLINSVGLQNPGIDAVINTELKKLEKVFHKPAVANACGFSAEEYEEVCVAFDGADQVGIIEVNVSCPNVHNGGMSFGTDARCAAQITKRIKNAVKKPVIIKLSPNVTNIVEIAKACESEGADGICLINTLLGMRIDLKTKKPIIANTMGGFSGPAVFPVAVRMVYQVANAVKVPVIGVGGIATAENVLEMMLAGATAVEIGAQNLVDPFVCRDIINMLPEVMDKYNIKSLKECIGGVN